jgi:hypothetical protein
MLFAVNDSVPQDFGSDIAPTISVVVAYEDLETGMHARKTCDSLERNLGEEGCFASEMWKFNLLTVPSFREMAANDAAVADIIIISSHGLAEMPADVKAWVELWLGRQTTAAALVALFDRPAECAGRVRAIQDYLATVARRGGMEFFAQPDIWPDNPATIARLAHQRATGAQHDAALPLAAVKAKDVFVGHWGLNE